MSHQRLFKPSGLATSVLASGVLVLTLACLENLSYGNRCQPPTPSPCAADGVCRPNRDSWGYSQTRWRQWPGDPRTGRPTDAATPDLEDDKGLPGYQTPKPEQEDLRGPAKGKKDEDAEDAGEGEDAQPLPGPEVLPGFDPQGNLESLPPVDDAPPALPESLRLSRSIPTRSIPSTSGVRVALGLSASTGTSRAKLINPALPASLPPVNWKQPQAIGLVNPASAAVVQPEGEALQQAIYYEASDQ